MNSVANTTLATFPLLLNGNLFPTGSQTFNSTPFTVGQTWSADVAAGEQRGQGLQSVTIPINTFGVTTMYTLMNSEWGDASGTFVNLIFTFGDGSTYMVGLVANQGIRDYNNYTWTNNISNSWSAPMGANDSTINAWTDDGMPCNTPPAGICSIAGGNYQRLDEQIINIPLAFQGLNLVSLTIVDGGDHASPQDALNPNPSDAERSFITGLTACALGPCSAAAVPEPGTWILALGGVGAILALRKRRA